MSARIRQLFTLPIAGLRSVPRPHVWLIVSITAITRAAFSTTRCLPFLPDSRR